MFGLLLNASLMTSKIEHPPQKISIEKPTKATPRTKSVVKNSLIAILLSVEPRRHCKTYPLEKQPAPCTPDMACLLSQIPVELAPMLCRTPCKIPRTNAPFCFRCIPFSGKSKPCVAELRSCLLDTILPFLVQQTEESRRLLNFQSGHQ
ncbi:MAG: hypothetical protein US35_C0022G0020 [Parcubacteria group bacterium GW2011_GWA2_37_10]|nr:MAG: hypothetical protein US35_C0022G0020 [Parcubacteria group bacterium GW2011_GWA2_37_10]